MLRTVCMYFNKFLSNRQNIDTWHLWSKVVLLLLELDLQECLICFVSIMNVFFSQFCVYRKQWQWLRHFGNSRHSWKPWQRQWHDQEPTSHIFWWRTHDQKLPCHSSWCPSFGSSRGWKDCGSVSWVSICTSKWSFATRHRCLQQKRSGSEIIIIVISFQELQLKANPMIPIFNIQEPTIVLNYCN